MGNGEWLRVEKEKEEEEEKKKGIFTANCKFMRYFSVIAVPYLPEKCCIYLEQLSIWEVKFLTVLSIFPMPYAQSPIPNSQSPMPNF
jgi:hypothetical protein